MRLARRARPGTAERRSAVEEGRRRTSPVRWAILVVLVVLVVGFKALLRHL